MKQIINNESGQGGIIQFFIGAMLATLIALSVVWPVMDETLYGDEAASSGTLTLSGNVTCGELVNVTNVAGKKVTLQLNITGTEQNFCTLPLTTPYDVVEIKQFWNTSTVAANNITTALNANASISGTMTATNPSAGVVRLVYNTAGTTGNSVATVDTLANGAWGAAVLQGGSWSTTHNMSTASTTLLDQLPLFLVLVLLMVFVKAII